MTPHDPYDYACRTTCKWPARYISWLTLCDDVNNASILNHVPLWLGAHGHLTDYQLLPNVTGMPATGHQLPGQRPTSTLIQKSARVIHDVRLPAVGWCGCQLVHFTWTCILLVFFYRHHILNKKSRVYVYGVCQILGWTKILFQKWNIWRMKILWYWVLSYQQITSNYDKPNVKRQGLNQRLLFGAFPRKLYLSTLSTAAFNPEPWSSCGFRSMSC